MIIRRKRRLQKWQINLELQIVLLMVHVDGHDDMNGSIPLDENASPIANVNIGNFICPAVHVGIVTDIYWVNPHSVTKRIQEFCLKDDEGSKNFGTTVYQGMLGWDTYAIYDQFKRVRDNIELSPEKPYILDVDLDGFCCDKHLSLDPFETEYFDHDAVNNYEKRIDETISLLDKLSRKPDLITITRSWGGEVSYVPTDKLYAVEQLFLGKLKEIYTK